ncbi:MAG: bifunctional adenosylcobinamide kinase/adenosylcobinamide-phosphate guanylyltransferase [Candidatus Marinarcus sp.]|uniref:bifunctional adenosylcobinamide kinase/adenosylcobinamide-phosphate guanylyltransferase n=1 Tax=Candidatus Marinarcus sp. TaxID=3100987 RepID=UPI003B00A78C
MKIFYFGGQKCGKTACAIQKTLELAKDKKPIYVATYLDNYNDKEMQERLKNHKKERSDTFITIEEGYDLSHLQEGETYLIDCLSMWILNNLEKTKEELITQIEKLFEKECNIVFILNDVSRGIIPLDSQSRKFVDLSGIIGQVVAKNCDEVYDVSYSIARQIK